MAETKINVEKTYTDPITGKFLKGNPGGGRPVDSLSVVGEIKKKLKERPDGGDKTYLDLLITRIFRTAIQKGDVNMIKDIINRIDGLPKGSAIEIDNRTIEKLIIIKDSDGSEIKSLAD